MRILVTGGAGFIGSHLVRRLLERGHEVRVLDDFSTGKRANIEGLPLEVLEGDIRSRAAVRSAMRQVEGVFHVAALPSVPRSWSDPVLSLGVNALGTTTVVEEAAAAGARVLVYSSSSSVYGDQPAERKSEDLDPNPISPYGFDKLLGEKIVLAHSRPGGLRTVALRYFNVFGPRQDPDSPYSAVIPLFIKHAVAGTAATINGDGGHSRDFTYVANVVEANLLAFEGDASGVALNAACGQAFTLLDLAEAIGRIHGRPLQVIHGPERPGDIRHSLADLSAGERALGYRPRVTFEEGLRLTYDAMRQD